MGETKYIITYTSTIRDEPYAVQHGGTVPSVLFRCPAPPAGMECQRDEAPRDEVASAGRRRGRGVLHDQSRPSRGQQGGCARQGEGWRPDHLRRELGREEVREEGGERQGLLSQY